MKIIRIYVTGTKNVILMDAFICLLVHLLIASTDVEAQVPGDESTACPIPSAMTSPHTYNYLDLINPAVGVWQQVPLDGTNGSDTGIEVIPIYITNANIGRTNTLVVFDKRLHFTVIKA